MSAPAIGIDLGTTYSVVGVWSSEDEMVQILDVDDNQRILPSCVSFSGDKRMFGSRAVQQLVNNAENTIFEVKRLMGRNYDDIVVQDYKRRFKVKVSKHEPSGKPQFQVTFCNQIRKFLPEEISAMILGRLKEIAEEHLKCVVTQAVITVPAYFNDVQRQATVDAGRIAGLQVLRILTEPTAAAIAYGMDERSILQDQKAMVFDLGGGTFDVSILQLQQDILEVVAISGDTFLGGEDFKQKMVDKYLCMYKDEFGEDLNSYPEQFNMVPLQCERAKRILSEKDHAQVGKDEVKNILLVGGSTRIPKIKSLIVEFFGGEERLCSSLNPDEAVAQGAALQAATLQNVGSITNALILQDVTPLSLGIAISGGRMAVVVPKNSVIPLRMQKNFTTTVHNQLAVRVSVYQGERTMINKNIFLGDFNVMVQRAQKGVPKIVVSFEINENGILKVSAVDTARDSTKYLKIQAEQYKISEGQVKAMLEDAARMAKKDKELEKRVEQQLYLQEYIDIHAKIVQNLSGDQKNQFSNMLNDMREWLQNNPQETAAAYSSKLGLLKELFKEVIVC
eukprot:TRINITY_DN5459_c0_g1_i7.p1 TRINITY_DN5459_c0_g1~~TRINITY_DN5459_c0_g1_i7.p1  ORF type:complete len:594 (+),score=102.36 TRINITY_DN5459_c0_g1_i7:94-1782(+)